MKTLITEKELQDQFIELLNDCNDLIKIGNLTYEAGYALQKLDPTAFRCGLNDFIDNQLSDDIIEEIDGDYYIVEN